MKRMKLGAAAAVLCLILGMTAQAAGSSASGVQISQDPITATVVKADGTTVESAQVIPVIEEGNTEAPAATVESALGIGSGEKYASYKLEVSLELNGEDVKLSGGSVTMTFKIPGVTANSKVAVLHWADGSSEPEKLSATAGEGTVTATFTSFSPVQIVVAEAEQPAQPEEPSDSSNGGNSSSSSSGSSNGSQYNFGNSVGGVQVSQNPITATVVKADGTTVENAQTVVAIKEGNGQVVDTKTAESALGIGSGAGYTSYQFDASLTLGGEKVSLKGGNVTVAFRVPGVTANSKVAVFHWAEGSAKPERLAAIAGDGIVTVTFTSFSPVQIVVANGTAAAVSPKTAEGNELYMAAAVAVIALTGFAVCMKKARY